MGSSNEEIVIDLQPWKPALGKACIYAVPDALRRVNPEAFSPQALLIGPLQLRKRMQALNTYLMLEASQKGTNDRNTNASDVMDKEESRCTYKVYAETEMQKKIYLKEFGERFPRDIIERLKVYIQGKEEEIRKCYAEQIFAKAHEVQDIILHDSVFIMEFLLRMHEVKGESKAYNDDKVVSKDYLQKIVFDDLFLLENQLPYFILKDLYCWIWAELPSETRKQSFSEFVMSNFLRHENSPKIDIPDGKDPKHLTDLLRLYKIKSFNTKKYSTKANMKHLYGVENLEKSGIEFVLNEGKDDLSINVDFEGNRLKMPLFVVTDNTEKLLRNVIALEQCHYPDKAYVSSYALLLDFLVETGRDVELLVEKGIIRNWIGSHGSVADMVNKISHGFIDRASYYHCVADDMNDHYNKWWNHAWTKVKRGYCSDIFKGTATGAGILLLGLSITETVVSLLQLLNDYGTRVDFS